LKILFFNTKLINHFKLAVIYNYPTDLLHLHLLFWHQNDYFKVKTGFLLKKIFFEIHFFQNFQKIVDSKIKINFLLNNNIAVTSGQGKPAKTVKTKTF